MAAKKQKTENKEDDAPRCMCAYFGCEKRAICKVKVSTTAWSNFCYHHYLVYHQDRAEETCERLGLKTTAEKRAWILEQSAKLAQKMRPSYLREPGEDDEERAA